MDLRRIAEGTGSAFQLPEQFESRRVELLDQLEPIDI
jgi:hypothetical protein